MRALGLLLLLAGCSSHASVFTIDPNGPARRDDGRWRATEEPLRGGTSFETHNGMGALHRPQRDELVAFARRFLVAVSEERGDWMQELFNGVTWVDGRSGLPLHDWVQRFSTYDYTVLRDSLDDVVVRVELLDDRTEVRFSQLPQLPQAPFSGEPVLVLGEDENGARRIVAYDER